MTKNAPKMAKMTKSALRSPKNDQKTTPKPEK
jgi:hypothetical protein